MFEVNPARARPVLSVQEMARADKLAIQGGISGLQLMENAGMAVAQAIMRFSPRRPVIILRGPGNNGGDGSVVARHLARRGWPVQVLDLANPDTLKGDAAVMAKRWRGTCAPLQPDALKAGYLYVDALFGAGLNRPLSGVVRKVVERLNDLNASVVAVDLPTGLNGDSGIVQGVALNCALTVTFFHPKPAHLTGPGRLCCGKVQVADIGIPATVVDDINPQTRVNGPGLWTMPFPAPTDHKYTRGHAVIIAGGVMYGAARLAALGARRIGAGLVTLAGPAAVLPFLGTDQPGTLLHPLSPENPLKGLLADSRHNAFLLGPGRGRGPETAGQALELVASGRAVVLDADALTSMPDGAATLAHHVKGPCVLTPHEGEFQIFFGKTLSGLSRLERARTAATLARSVVILKGADTIIAHPDGRAAINTNAPSTLATAGSGDVLAGIVTGLLAQKMTPFEAACLGVWCHTQSARQFGPGLIAEDIIATIPKVLRKIGHLQNS